MSPAHPPRPRCLCCAPLPPWTARVGQRWRPYPYAPWNAYNALWRAQHAYLNLRERTDCR